MDEQSKYVASIVFPGYRIGEIKGGYAIGTLSEAFYLRIDKGNAAPLNVVLIKGTPIFPDTIDDIVMEVTDGLNVAYWVDPSGKHYDNAENAMIAIENKRWYAGVVQ